MTTGSITGLNETSTLRRKSVHNLCVIPAQAGIQGLETNPGFRVCARNDNVAYDRKVKKHVRTFALRN